MRYWWVMQGTSQKHASKGGFLWAPYVNDKGKTDWSWDTMDELRKNDLVFSFVKGEIKAVSKVKGRSYKADRPSEGHKTASWASNGRKCDVVYKKLNDPIVLKEHLSEIVNLRYYNRRSPFKENGNENQFYLMEISSDLANYLLQYFDKKLLLYNQAQEGEVETIEQEGKDGSGNNQRRKVTTEITRVIRDTKLSKNIKREYDYKCQICSTTIIAKTKSGKYAEGAHIKPIEDYGDDKKNNLICLCPNHHKMLDCGAITINDDLTISGTETGKLFSKHRINKANLKFHRENIFIDP